MKKKILVLGGTLFVGRVLVETLLLHEDKYEVTLFNRGKTNPNLFPNVRRLVGNRENNEIAALGKESWDAVIDVSGYYPLSLEKLVALLKGKVGRYIFVSTASVYKIEESEDKIMDENFATETCTEAQKRDMTMATYGKRKVACEQVLLRSGIDALIVRPAVIYGRYDPYDRHYYWLYRAKHSEQILLPGGSENRSNSTFVDDLASILQKGIEIERHQSIYNVTTHPVESLRQQVSAMASAFGRQVQFVEAPLDFLEKHEVQPWTDIPLWINGNFMMLDHSRMERDFGLSLTPLTNSFAKTAAYYESLEWKVPRMGVELDEEQELIAELESNE